MIPASLVLLVALAPLIGAFAIALRMLFGRLAAGSDAEADAGERPTARIAMGCTGLSLLLMLVLGASAIASGAPGHVRLGTWFAAGAFEAPVSFVLDAPSLGIGTLVAVIVALTVRFSVAYMHREAGFHRFFLGLCLFAAGMLLIVLAGNAVLAFVGWELAGVSSYMLIGYARQRGVATANAVRAFVTNRVGDAGFVAGIATAFLWIGTVEWNGIGRSAASLDTLPAGLMCLGFVVAALAKSGQVPFSPWIARALEGPTPSSALFYGSVMVHAGVYLLIRLEPVLRHAPAVTAVLAALGLLTVLYGWLAGLVQTDIKSSLAFAATTQVGLMFLACGLGAFELAAWHLALHASWRAYQFLVAPSYLHLVEEPAAPVPRWLARHARLYTAALERFWLEAAGDWLLVRPTRGLGADMNALDAQVIDRVLGAPDGAPAAGEIVRGRGAAGAALEAAAARLARIETHLVLQGPGGRLARVLARAGEYLEAVDLLLQRPRYLLLLIMATFAVIL